MNARNIRGTLKFLKSTGKRIIMVLGALSLIYCQSKPVAKTQNDAKEICDTQSIMATAWTICLIDPQFNEEELRKRIQLGMDEIHRIDEWMSEWKENSLVSQVNQNSGIKPVPLTDEAFDAFKLAVDHGALTDGAFDISFNAFFGMYSWKKGQEKFPTPAQRKRLLPLVNYRNIILDPAQKTAFLKIKGMKVGFGGMGQGWAVDKVVKVLRDQKKTAAGYVDGSGDTYFWGKKPNGSLWTVGISDPRSENKDVLFKLYLTDKAVTTSGDTEKYFIKDGIRYHHLIDPRTGDSARHVAQVTAICDSATLCDIADGGIFVLGPEKGMKYAHKSGIHAVAIGLDRVVHLSKGLKPVRTPWGPSLEVPP